MVLHVPELWFSSLGDGNFCAEDPDLYEKVHLITRHLETLT
jgi:hypothetical protein